MKKLIPLLLMLVIATTPSWAQKRAKAPTAVTQAFQMKFVDASKVTWYKMASNNWFADFILDSIPSKAEYTANGQWIATRLSLDTAHLPDTLMKAISLKYPGAAIQQITQIQRSDISPYYQIDLKMGDLKKEILANNSGTITE